MNDKFKSLPDRRAPASLKRGVMLRVKPWHQRPWWTWNPAARAAFATSLAASVGVLWLAARPLAAALHAKLGWTLTVASAFDRALGPAVVALIALAVLPTAALSYIKEKA